MATPPTPGALTPDEPTSATPLYHHPLPALEAWLGSLGALQQPSQPCCWDLHGAEWTAQIELEVEELKVSWHNEGQVSVRYFPSGLSRADAEAAILAGP